MTAEKLRYGQRLMADRTRSIPAICREVGDLPASTLYHYPAADPRPRRSRRVRPRRDRPLDALAGEGDSGRDDGEGLGAHPRAIARVACAPRPRLRCRSPGYRPTGGVEISQQARFPCVVFRHDGRLQGAGRGVPGVRAFAPRGFCVVRRSRTGRSFHDGVFPRPRAFGGRARVSSRLVRALVALACFLLRVFFPHRLGSARPGVGWHACLHRSRPRNRASSSAISRVISRSSSGISSGGRPVSRASILA